MIAVWWFLRTLRFRLLCSGMIRGSWLLWFVMSSKVFLVAVWVIVGMIAGWFGCCSRVAMGCGWMILIWVFWFMMICRWLGSWVGLLLLSMLRGWRRKVVVSASDAQTQEKPIWNFLVDQKSIISPHRMRCSSKRAIFRINYIYFKLVLLLHLLYSLVVHNVFHILFTIILFFKC